MKKGSAWNEETAHLTYCKEGRFLVIDERPLWAIIAEKAGEQSTAVTGHLLCCNIPGWAHKIRWGPVDEDGFTDKCLAAQMSRLGNWLGGGCGAFRQRREVARIDVEKEWIAEHYPEMDHWPWTTDEMPDELCPAGGMMTMKTVSNMTVTIVPITTG